MAKRKRTSKIAKDKLARLDVDTVLSLNEIRKDDKLKEAVVVVVRRLIEEEKDFIMGLNPGRNLGELLNVKHADAKGRIGGLTTFVHMIEGSGDEIERREEETKK